MCLQGWFKKCEKVWLEVASDRYLHYLLCGGNQDTIMQYWEDVFIHARNYERNTMNGV